MGLFLESERSLFHFTLLSLLIGLRHAPFLAASAYVLVTGTGALTSVFRPSVTFLTISLTSPTRSWDVAGLVSFRELMCLCPIITSLNLRKRFPCSGFVKKSASICSVGQYSTSMFPRPSRSFIKKYRISMCLEFGPHDLLPFFSKRMVLWLSWYSTFSCRPYRVW
jgi:hypothetical protein